VRGNSALFFLQLENDGGDSKGVVLWALTRLLPCYGAVAALYFHVEPWWSLRYGAGPRLLYMGVFLQVAEEQEGGLRGPHCEVHILGRHVS
jgi:hypothetical protein